MFDFTNAILLAASVATNVVFGVVLLINHTQQKAHNADNLDMEYEIEELTKNMESQRDYAREMFVECEQDIKEVETDLGQAMAYATDLETVIEAALDTIMEQRETIEKLTIAVIGGDPDVDDVSHIDYFVFTDGTVVVN